MSAAGVRRMKTLTRNFTESEGGNDANDWNAICYSVNYMKLIIQYVIFEAVIRYGRRIKHSQI